jgi:Flp pilus assembly CpaE family ATPase
MKPYIKSLLQVADRIILVVEPVYPSDTIGRALLQDLETSGIDASKIGLALINRVATSLQIPWRQVEQDMGIELAGIVSPAPEQAHQAAQSGSPLVISYSDNLIGDQLNKLAQNISNHLKPVEG